MPAKPGYRPFSLPWLNPGCLKRPLIHFAIRAAALLLLTQAAQAHQPDWALGPFSRPASGNPIVAPDPAATFNCPVTGQPVAWESLHTFNPAAAVKDGQVFLVYRAEDASGRMEVGGHTSRLGLAVSSDGIHFQRRPEPVLFPDHDAQAAEEWSGGCEDPRLVEAEDGRFILTYTQFHRGLHPGAHLAVATTRDFLTWEKHGNAFAKAGARFSQANTKSGAIVTSLRDGHQVAARIQGRYWMYYGEEGLNLASSTDLLDWTPVQDAQGNALKVLPLRKGNADSALAEGGPCPILTSRGIVVLYNGKNAAPPDGDPALATGVYTVGQALFSAEDPTKLLDRAQGPCLQPEAAFEKTGQYQAGTTFAEGLVMFKGHWHLYYGCADSFVGVAVAL